MTSKGEILKPIWVTAAFALIAFVARWIISVYSTVPFSNICKTYAGIALILSLAATIIVTISASDFVELVKVDEGLESQPPNLLPLVRRISRLQVFITLLFFGAILLVKCSILHSCRELFREQFEKADEDNSKQIRITLWRSCCFGLFGTFIVFLLSAPQTFSVDTSGQLDINQFPLWAPIAVDLFSDVIVVLGPLWAAFRLPNDRRKATAFFFIFAVRCTVVFAVIRAGLGARGSVGHRVMVLDVWGIVQAYFSLISEDAIASMRVLRINGKEGIKKSVQSLRSPFRSPNPPQKSTFEV